MAHPQKYRSLSLAKALSSRWTRLHKLNSAEITLLLWVAIWGDLHERGMAFTWFPMRGMDDWAESLGISRPTLFRATRRLIAEGLLVQVHGAGKDSRFRGMKGFAIPNRVMDEVSEWSIRGGKPASSDISNSETKSVSRMIHAGSRSETFAPPLTCDDTEYTHIEPREENPLELKLQPSTVRRSARRSPPDPSTQPDLAGTFRPDLPSSEGAGSRRSISRPAARLAQHFYDAWMVARQDSPNLALPWSNKAGFLKNLNTMLKDFSEEQIRAMIDVFFQQAVANTVYLGSPELWRDFLSARAKCWQIVTQSGVLDEAPSQEYLTERRKAALAWLEGTDN